MKDYERIAKELKRIFPNKEIIPQLTREQFNAIIPFELEQDIILSVYEDVTNFKGEGLGKAFWYNVNTQSIIQIPKTSKFIVLECYSVENFYIGIKYTIDLSKISVHFCATFTQSSLDKYYILCYYKFTFTKCTEEWV